MSNSHYEGMLNPGFCAVLITAMTETAEIELRRKQEGLGLPWPMTYLLVPFALHQGKSKLIERSQAKSLGELVRSYPEMLIGVDRLVFNAAPFVRLGLAVALSRNAIQVNQEHLTLLAVEGRLATQGRRLDEILSWEDRACVRAASRLGRWAAHESVSQVCTILRIQPRWMRVHDLRDQESPHPEQAS